MTRGPKKGGAKRADQHQANAKLAWGFGVPVWIAALARACDTASLSAVATRVGYSSGALSMAINAKYPGDMAALEKAVRGVLLAEKLACPVLGLIPGNDCLANQRQALTTASPQGVRLSRACPSCAHRQGGNHG